MTKELILFALDLKGRFSLDRNRRYDVKYIWKEIDVLTKEYLNKKKELK